MSALDATIDGLYQLPLAEFTSARNALAKTLKGDEAKRVRALGKPTVVPWAVNQVYWRARGTYDRLMKSGEQLRAAQIAALQGRAADVRAASDAHRRAIGDAVAEAERLSAASGAKPGTDALARTFEALSLATAASQTPGRMTETLQPAGFEALTGITPQPTSLRVVGADPRVGPGRTHGSAPTAQPTNEPRTTNAEPRTKHEERRAKAAAEAAAKEAERVAAEKRRHEEAVKKAEEELARVEGAERHARDVWERAHDDLLAARQALTDLRRTRFRPS